jgi:RNA polymerase sigma-70 factor, ECF subfamily
VAPANDHELAYQRWGPALVRKAARIVRNREDAVDIVHALFTDLIARREDAVDLPYLYRAVTNRSLNLIRDASSRARLLARESDAVTPAARLSSSTRVVGIDMLARLCARLDQNHRDVLVAHFVDEMTQEEIAQLYGVSRKTVGKRLANVESAAAAVIAESEAA